MRRHVVAHVVVDVANHPALPRQPDDRRQEGLRDAVGDVRAFRIAPLRDDVAVARDDAAGAAAILHRTDDGVVRLLAEAAVEKQRHVLRALRLRGQGDLHRLVDERRVHADVVGLLVLPVEALGKVDRLRPRLGRGAGRANVGESIAVLRESRRDDDGGEDERKCASQHGLSPYDGCSIVHEARRVARPRQFAASRRCTRTAADR